LLVADFNHAAQIAVAAFHFIWIAAGLALQRRKGLTFAFGMQVAYLPLLILFLIGIAAVRFSSEWFSSSDAANF
jgi:threonine/homoserine/homoserine lactone efflux protein